jgi:mannan endo-1,4-beta-mannosidase
MVVLSAHIYPESWNQAAGHSVQPSDMDVLAGSGKPCIVGEYGTHTGQGPVNVISVVNRAKQVGCWAVLAWAWNGDGGSLNMVNPTWGQNPKSGYYSESSYFWEVSGPL